MPVSSVADGTSPRFDRSAAERDSAEAVEVLRASRDTRVLALWNGRAPLADDALRTVEPQRAVDATEWAFLGRRDGVALLLAIVDDDTAARIAPEGDWVELRTVGGDLDEIDTAVFMTALSLSRFLLEASFCPVCGGAAELRQAGWSRRCASCGREHFPRTDPAVIVAITDDSGENLLLGSNAAWPAGRYSCFAGFVEAGESAESALLREVEEESGVRISRFEYVGSQGWPYPRSLMLGYLATASGEAVADGEEIVEVRWFTPDEIGAALDGDDSGITLPGRASIARRLIETWHARATAVSGAERA